MNEGESEYLSVCGELLEFLRLKGPGMASAGYTNVVNVFLYTCGSQRILPPASFYQELDEEVTDLATKGVQIQLHFFGVSKLNALEEGFKTAFSNASYNPANVASEFFEESNKQIVAVQTQKVLDGVHTLNIGVSPPAPEDKRDITLHINGARWTFDERLNGMAEAAEYARYGVDVFNPKNNPRKAFLHYLGDTIAFNPDNVDWSVNDIYGELRRIADVKILADELKWIDANNKRAAKREKNAQEIAELQQVKNASLLDLEVQLTAADAEAGIEGLLVSVAGQAKPAVVTTARVLIMIDMSEELTNWDGKRGLGALRSGINNFLRTLRNHRSEGVSVRLVLCDGSYTDVLDGAAYEDMVASVADDEYAGINSEGRWPGDEVSYATFDNVFNTVSKAMSAQPDKHQVDPMMCLAEYVELCFGLSASQEHNVTAMFFSANPHRANVSFDVASRVRHRVLELAERGIYVQTAALGARDCNGGFVNSLSVINFDPRLTLVEYTDDSKDVADAVKRLSYRAAYVNEYYPFRVSIRGSDPPTVLERLNPSANSGSGAVQTQTFLITAMSEFDSEDFGFAQQKSETIAGSRVLKLAPCALEYCIGRKDTPATFASIVWASSFPDEYFQHQGDTMSLQPITPAPADYTIAKEKVSWGSLFHLNHDIQNHEDRNVRKVLHLGSIFRHLLHFWSTSHQSQIRLAMDATSEVGSYSALHFRSHQDLPAVLDERRPGFLLRQAAIFAEAKQTVRFEQKILEEQAKKERSRARNELATTSREAHATRMIGEITDVHMQVRDTASRFEHGANLF